MSSGRPLACLAAVATLAGCVGSSPRSQPLRPLASLPAADPAGPQDLWQVDPAQQTMSSLWYLDVGGEPLTVALSAGLDGAHASGTVTGDDGSVAVADQVTWDAATGVLDFRRAVDASSWQWMHARAVEGVVTGRASYASSEPAPPTDVAAYGAHVVGWNDRYFARDIVPRVFDLTVDGKRARLRLDRDAGGALVGRFKVYADDVSGIAAEEVEYDVDVQTWDGRNLTFVRSSPSWTQTFVATVDGRTLAGSMSSTMSDAPASVEGTRVELVGYGLVPRDAASLADWQERARRQLAHLVMADNPTPLSLSADRQPVDVAIDSGDVAADRDDDADDWPVDYSVDELALTATLPNPYGDTPLARAMHGYLTTPSGDVPAGGWPALVVLNGHSGSALGTLDPYEPNYWYGDAWARRGYVVLALDVGHRPLADRAALYRNYTDGDRPADGNGPHPAIAADGLDSDWAEDGERTWDVERAVDYLVGLGIVDGARIAVTGLSMGAEVASFAGALDTRIAAVVPAGFIPDLDVMAGNGNHGCWKWLFGDPTDYFSVSDLHALIAPRPVVAETGLDDAKFSRFSPPYVAAKEVARRSRAAFVDVPSQFVLYLHPDGHDYRFGDVIVADGSAPLDVTVPQVDGPRASGDLSWATDGTTVSLGETLADVVTRLVPTPAP
jgi:dienelactone hydrolase